MVEIFFSNSSELDSFSGVLSWVLKTHAEALKSLTSEIAPFLETAVGFDEQKDLFFPTSTPNEYHAANVDNLLLRSMFLGFSYEYIMALDKVKNNIKVSADKMRKIKEKTVDLIKAYASTKDALEAIKKVSNPVSKAHFNFAMLRKKENITNVKKLTQFEKVAKDYMKEIRKQDWTRFPHVDPSIWKEKAKDHTINVGNREYETQLYQYPILNWHPLNIHTDIERMLIPFFIVQERIDESYIKCRSLFEKCKNSSGFLRGPPSELKDEAIKALEEFNINYGGITYPAFYAERMTNSINRDKEYGISRIRPHKFSLNDLDKLIAKPSQDGSVEHAPEIVKQIHYLVSWERNINHP